MAEVIVEITDAHTNDSCDKPYTEFVVSIKTLDDRVPRTHARVHAIRRCTLRLACCASRVACCTFARLQVACCTQRAARQVWTVAKRYSDFRLLSDALHHALKGCFPAIKDSKCRYRLSCSFKDSGWR